LKKTSGLTKINGRTKNAITIKYVPLDKIKPWGKNPKKHDKEQIRISIERYGFRDPIAVNRKNDEVEAGHGRLSVIAEMMKEGAEPPAGIQVAHGVWKVPVIYFDDDEITQYKYAIMHNRSTELGGWNNKTLAGVLKEIFASDDMIGTGFDDDIFKVDLGKRGRPKIDINWEELDKLCQMQCTLTEIASWFNVSEDTIERRCKEMHGITFQEYFSRKRAGGLVALRRAQFQLALKNPAMAIFLGKNYLGQKDKQDINVGHRFDFSGLSDAELEAEIKKYE